MNHNHDQVIGIVGGMGPQAGVALLHRINCLDGGASDQAHLPAILMSFPGQIVDRSAFLNNETAVNPAYAIAGIIQKLEAVGAQVVGLACNTSYSPAIYQVIIQELLKQGSTVNLLHMPQETCRYIREHHPALRKIGVLSTNGVYDSGVYKKMLDNWGFEMIVPDRAFQQSVVHRMIYDPVIGIKANPEKATDEVQALLQQALDFFWEQEAEAIILGCTEFSLVLTEQMVKGMLIVDSTEAMARALIREARTGKKKTINTFSDVLT